jgi:ketosteroid isomerase-like protein
MPQENVEIVRRLYEAGPELTTLLRDGGNLVGHPWLSLWHPECVLEEIADVPDAATYHGREGVVRYFQRALEEVWDEWRFEPVEVLEGSDGVFVAVDNWGRSKAGAELALRIFQAFRLRDGLIAFAAGYLNRGEALKAVGLEEE